MFNDGKSMTIGNEKDLWEKGLNDGKDNQKDGK